jgi:hypothetical protein
MREGREGGGEWVGEGASPCGRTRPQGDGRPRSAAGADPCGPPDRTCPPAWPPPLLPPPIPRWGSGCPGPGSPLVQAYLLSRQEGEHRPAARGNAAGPSGLAAPWGFLLLGACSLPFPTPPSLSAPSLLSLPVLWFSSPFFIYRVVLSPFLKKYHL